MFDKENKDVLYIRMVEDRKSIEIKCQDPEYINELMRLAKDFFAVQKEHKEVDKKEPQSGDAGE